MRPIDADALYERFEGSGWYCNADRDDIAEELLLDAPTLTLDDLRPKGEWIITTETLGFSDVSCIACSNCKESWILDEDLSPYDCNWFYCPNCGAKIGGVCDCGVMILDFESKAEAVSAWNTRAGESE